MAAPTKVYASKRHVNFTAAQLRLIEAEAVLTNRTFSEVVRDCVTQYFMPKEKE